MPFTKKLEFLRMIRLSKLLLLFILYLRQRIIRVLRVVRRFVLLSRKTNTTLGLKVSYFGKMYLHLDGRKICFQMQPLKDLQ